MTTVFCTGAPVYDVRGELLGFGVPVYLEGAVVYGASPCNYDLTDVLKVAPVGLSQVKCPKCSAVRYFQIQPIENVGAA